MGRGVTLGLFSLAAGSTTVAGAGLSVARHASGILDLRRIAGLVRNIQSLAAAR